MERVCRQCGHKGPEGEFKSRKGVYENLCKVCANSDSRQFYLANKEYFYKKDKERYEDMTEWFKEIKSKLSCTVCGESHIACLDFHHRDPSTKKFSLSRHGAGKSKDTVLAEIAKCNVLCSNCHRKLHYEEGTTKNNKHNK